MRPLEISPSLDSLIDIHPPASTFLKVILASDRDARHAIARLWLSEGPPFAFRNKPSVYEALRLWVARQLDVRAKEITIIGSARQGFALSADKNIGRPFGPHADLDMTIVSENLFERLRNNFEKWQQDYKQGEVRPRHERERVLWDENLRTCPGALKSGFIDPQKIPTWSRYKNTQLVMDTVWRLSEKLKATPQAPAVRKVSVRVYQEWDACIRQMAINLEHIAKVHRAK